MRHTISVLVRNEFGVLSRVAGMFSGRGYNIDSLNVAPTLDPKVSHMTLVTTGDDETIEQITKQLHKLIDVITVKDFVGVADFVGRELAMLKVAPAPDARDEVLRIVEIFRAKDDRFLGPITIAQTISLCLIAFGIWGMARLRAAPASSGDPKKAAARAAQTRREKRRARA